MDNRKNLTDRLCSIDSSLRADDILLPVDFNLLPDRSKTRVDGITVLLSDKMLHTKLVLNEKEISLGSCNMTKKAFRQLDELNLCVKNTDDPFPSAIRASLAREREAATPVTTYREIGYRRALALAEGLLV